MPRGRKDQKRTTSKGAKGPSANAISRWENEGGATKKLPPNLPEDPVARSVAIMRESTEKPVKRQKKGSRSASSSSPKIKRNMRGIVIGG